MGRAGRARGLLGVEAEGAGGGEGLCAVGGDGEIQTARPGRSEAPRIRAMPPTPWPIVGSDRASRSIVVHQQKV
jgi:hypothetical protein